MQNPQPLTGTTAVRPSAALALAQRPGQLPRSDRAVPRLCFLSVPTATCDAWRRLGELGLGVALGLEPSERAALGWKGLAELVRRAGELGLSRGFVVGASSEPLTGAAGILEQLTAISEQANVIEEAGGVPLLLPLASLSRRRAREDEYVELYQTLFARSGGPVLVDWTGASLRPELAGYFPGRSFERVMALEPLKVRGARLALLDVAREVRLRRDLAAREQLLFTADRGHLGHLLLGANPGPAVPYVPAITRYTELAGQRVALGDFSHAFLSGSMTEAEALAKGLERLEARDAAGMLALLLSLAS